MSRVVTNRGRQRFRVAVNGESLSDDFKTAREGTQEPVKQEHSQQQAKEHSQQQAKEHSQQQAKEHSQQQAKT